MILLDFLRAVVTAPEGHFCLSTSNASEGWKEHWFNWPSQQAEIVERVHAAAQTHNVYYTAHLFSERSSAKAGVLPSRTIQADLDHADVYSSPIPPTIVVETSPERFQAYWILKDGPDYSVPTDILEQYSRKITYAIPECDRSGWPLGHRLRLPDTYNYKYEAPHHITVVGTTSKRIEPTAFDILPDLDEDTLAEDTNNREWINLPHLELDIPPTELVNELTRDGKISSRVRAQYGHPAVDRSEALWQLMCELFSAQFGRDVVYWIAYNSDNNKFLERRYGATRDLRKDVLRAELHIHAKGTDIRSSINEIRKDIQVGTTNERLTKIARMIINHMRSNGNFFHARDGRLFYVNRYIAKPIPVPASGYTSEWLSTLLTVTFGINSSLQDCRYIVAEIQAYVKNLPPITEVAALSYYDESIETMFIHTGAKEIYAITRDEIKTEQNGVADILFNWSGVLEPFRLDNRPLPANKTWYEIMFESTMETSVNVNKAQGTAMMAVWFMFLLFRNAASTRPILALLGMPGAGKSACFRKIYRLLYGKMRDLHQITNSDDFDIATSTNPLVVYDNVDSYERWLPDRLAMATTASETEKRKLFTDQDTIILKRAALVGVTAHSPKFIREDVADRLLVIMFERRDSFDAETDLLGEVSRLRYTLWHHILEDVRRVLSTPKPTPAEIPEFRIKDFSVLGLWIARGIGVEQDFLSGLSVVKGSQTDLVIEEEFMLVTAIRRYIQAHPEGDFYTAGELFASLPTRAPDPTAFMKTYKSGVTLGKKLFVMANALKSHFNVEWRPDEKTGTRLWSFKEKEKMYG